MSTILINAVPIEVCYRDGHKETINLGELSIRQLYVFIKQLGASDTPALVALCAGKPPEWIDTLSDDSFDALASQAIKLNFTRAVARAKSDPVAAAMLAPLALSFANVMRSQQTLGSFGSDLSPAPAASESAAETGNGSSTSRPADLTPS
jgi:hypothetical protein